MTPIDLPGFRTFLHLSRMRARRAELMGASGFPSEDPLGGMAGALARASQARDREDWLAYEIELFRLAAFAFAALETHRLGLAGATHPRERWCWEAICGPPRTGCWASRADAVAQAEAELPPGSSYRIGRLEAASLHRYMPTVAWLLEGMRERCRQVHQAPDLDWPHLDPRQQAELQAHLEGLVGAFLEREGLPLTLARWAEVDTHEVGPAARKAQPA